MILCAVIVFSILLTLHASDQKSELMYYIHCQAKKKVSISVRK